MRLGELSALLKTTGLPVTYHHWAKGQDPELPYIIYFEQGSDGFFADNTNYLDVKDVKIELYTDSKDIDHEELLESVLKENELSYISDELWIESEEMFEKFYEISLI